MEALIFYQCGPSILPASANFLANESTVRLSLAVRDGFAIHWAFLSFPAAGSSVCKAAASQESVGAKLLLLHTRRPRYLGKFYRSGGPEHDGP